MPSMSGATEEVLVSRSGHVATITINRPQKLNTVTAGMGTRLYDLVADLNQDSQVRVVVLRGAGDRAFSAGSDVGVLDDYGSNWQLRNRADYNRALWALRKPLIASIRGYAIGGGLELALTCDIRFASPSARFGAGEIKLGWHGGAGNTQLLPRLVGYGTALQMLLSGDLVDADEAYRIGLIQELVPEEELDQRVEALASAIASNSPIAVELTKHLVRISESTSLEVGLAYENDMFAYCFTTQDSREGRDAFLQKRPPEFRGE